MTTILVVDDSAVDRCFVKALLEKNTDWKVLCAEDGDVALDQIRAAPPELVVTDLRMPRLNGLELVAAVREEFAYIPVILMTSQGSEDIALQALSAGAASYSPKTQLAQDLMETVRAVLSVSLPPEGDSRVKPRFAKDSWSFVLDNDSSLIPPLIGVIQDKLVEPCLRNEGDRIRVGVALEEALANALYHGNLEISSSLKDVDDRAFYALARERRELLPYRDRRIYVDARPGDDEVTVIIRDEGPGFDPTTLPDPTNPENLERAHGRGLLLIRTFMDQVSHNSRGNEITLVKRRGTGEEAA
jgi:DNA-binding NarL/FixJ family response regulator/anti-sigma regulatory factor (Ser/Thr protein kinase)